MDNHEDFLDEYIEYRIFEKSMKGNGGRLSKKNSGCGFLTTAVVICAVAALVVLLSVCSNIF